MGSAHAPLEHRTAIFLAAAVAAAVYRAGRTLSRGLLLGLFFYDAGAGPKRPARPGARHGWQLRVLHRHLRARSERRAHLLPEPFTTAILFCDGGPAPKQ